MKKFVCLLFLLIIFPLKVNASNATISVSASTKNLVVGKTVSVTVKITSSSAIGAWQFDLKHDSSYLTVTSGSENLHVADSTKSATGQKTVTYNYTFKAKKSGTTSLVVSNYSVGDLNSEGYMSVSTNPNSVTLKIITQAQLESTYSKNNFLSSLGVEGAVLSEEFKSDVVEYSVDLPPNTEKINITGELADSKASIDGLGEKTLSDGMNKFLIKVTAQNGDIKTYTINVNVKEFDPITVSIDNKNYTIVRKKGLIEMPKDYVEKIVSINNEEIIGCESEVTKLVLIPLKNEDGNISWYVYDNNKYILYKEIDFSNIRLYVLDFDLSLVPKNYVKKNIIMGDYSVDFYKTSDETKFGLLYGMNVLTGEKNIYSYDEIEKTVQRYNSEEIEKTDAEKHTLLLVIIGILMADVIAIITIFIIKSRKKKRKSI